MNPAAVARVSVVVEYADGTVHRVACDHPYRVDSSPVLGSLAPVAFPAADLDISIRGAMVRTEAFEGRLGAQAGVQMAIGAEHDRAGVRDEARKRMRRHLACAVIDAGCVMLALPKETITEDRRPWGETVMRLDVPVAPAA